jgi:hypothetical protein
MKRISVIFALFLSGCVSAPESTTRPEVAINADAGAVKAAIIAKFLPYGYAIESESEHQIKMTRPLDSWENTYASLAVGNSYSVNHREAAFTLLPSPVGVRVLASVSIVAQMPGGQVNRREMTSNRAVASVMQGDLDSVKRDLENAATSRPLQPTKG